MIEAFAPTDVVEALQIVAGAAAGGGLVALVFIAVANWSARRRG